MADNTQEQGNIKNEFNQAVSGMNMDNAINQIPKGQLTYALNASVENFDSNSVSYQNEQGNEFCLQFPTNYLLIGTHFIPEKNKHLFFITNPTTGDSEIGYMDNNDCIYHTLVNAPCLNFNIQHPIHKVVHKITNCKTEIYWTDGFNPRRYLDIENIPYKLTNSSTFCNPVESNQLDCNQLKLQPNFNIPGLAVVDVVTGGNLTAGTVQFAVQYCDAQGNPYTSYYSVTNPTPIADTFLTTVNFNYLVGKSVVVEVSNLDSSGQFQYYNLAVIKTVNDITSVELIGIYFIDNPTRRITYTGQIVDNIRLSINDIFEKQPYYEIAEDLTAVQDVLVWDGLISVDRINYQSIANQIILQWETYKIPATENYADELNATNLRGYLRDEVYAFEIVFLLTNGKQTDGFHIPGRAATFLDLTPINITNNDFIGEPDLITNTSPYWKIYNTASVIGNSTGLPIGNATPHQYGDFAYWESTEKYPCNTQVWGSLSDQPIRHHKFPDVLVSPIYESALLTTGAGLYGMVMQNDTIYPIGVKIDTIQIQSLIAASSLTNSQKEDIVGYKIVRGDRSTNKSIVAKGMLRNVGKYTREEEDFIYPNYPYNDLNKDSFILESNNAWSLDAKPWLVTCKEIDPVLGYAEVYFTDPNSNKQAIKKLLLNETLEFCSVTRPLTKRGVCIIGPANYDVWTATSCLGSSGFRIFYDDPFTDDNTLYKHNDPWLSNTLCFPLGKCSTETARVAVDGVVTDDCHNPFITYCACKALLIKQDSIIMPLGVVTTTELGRRSSINCSNPDPLNTISTDASLKYRQIFNSPETSFGQPFLGNVLKLEQVMYGAGKAHFVEVKNNAKYRLLTKEAQVDALNSSREVAAITASFNVGAMFAVYQSYLTIYVNGITRKNYAYSFNSRANYDYNVSIPNNLGIKQREIDVARYLIPVVQNVGDKIGGKDVNINNYQRETSVYIKTKGSDNSIPALPFPSDSPNMSVTGIKDYSRFSISDNNMCPTPAKEQDISVVSYYASMKNIFVNQWGQIYTYNTIDTGFQRMFNASSSSSTVFGGDTFISRFAFKTKLPYFIDNRVNGLDDSDIFYDEIGNVGYPKYWHSARSVLETWSGADVGTLINIISYKAHNFDCPNDPIPTSGSERTFYNGYFYLFAYGIPNFYCESSYNVDLRQAFNNKEGDFWPHVSNGIPDDWLQESFVSIQNDNTYNYNVTYSKQNKENYFSHIPFDWDQTCYTYYPFRAIYSDPQNTDVDNKVNNWLTYKAISYFDFPQNYGKLISLDGIQNRAVLARFENKSLMYDNLLTIDTSNPQAAYMGNPLMFRKSPPIDFAETDLGYVGSQNKLLLKIPQGQLTIDAKRGQVFLISGTQATDLSQFGSGMNRFFTDHLAFEILRYFPDVDTDNHFNGIGLHAVYDSKFDRIIISKLDYIPLYKDIKYYVNSKEFYLEEVQSNGVVIKTLVYLTDPEYFCNKSWTLSYNINTKSWISFHSYIPNWYIAENNFFYSGLNGCCTDIDLSTTNNFDAIVGKIDLPETTTTTTTLAVITTTSTTTEYIDCRLKGTVEETSCVLEGTAIITVEPTPTTTICSRPSDLLTYLFITGYQVDSLSPVISTNNFEDACAAVTFLPNVDPVSITALNTISVMTTNLSVNSVLYQGLGTTCDLVPDGWYFTDESFNTGNIYNIVGGVLEGIYNCNCNTTTTSTTTINVEQCCGTLFNSGSSIYYYNSSNALLTLLNIPGYTSSLGIVMTSNYLWSIDTTIEQWDIFLTPFSATYNTSITLPIGFVASGGMVAKNDDIIITTDASTSPVNVVELNVTDTTAVLTVMFALPADRINITNMLYTTDEKLIMVTQDSITSDYYITQYDYIPGTIELDINIGILTPTSIFECECSIMLTDAAGVVYTIDKINPYTVVEMLTLPITIEGATQVQSCVVSSLIETTTTTTTV